MFYDFTKSSTQIRADARRDSHYALCRIHFLSATVELIPVSLHVCCIIANSRLPILFYFFPPLRYALPVFNCVHDTVTLWGHSVQLHASHSQVIGS